MYLCYGIEPANITWISCVSLISCLAQKNKGLDDIFISIVLNTLLVIIPDF